MRGSSGVTAAAAPAGPSRRPDQPFLEFGSSHRLPHLPALDGLRGLAVVAVVVFHGTWEWAKGGFLGVSLFFTLSGFLICSLLIAEHRGAGRIDLGAFWGRRFRRLLPAAWLTLTVVVVVEVALRQFTGSDRLDVWASLANVANWRFLAAGTSYNELFTEPSPVRHFWSLAIEEQCYVLVPVAVALALRFSRRGRVALTLVLGTMLAASIAATLLSDAPDRVYYGTDTRAAELLIGALLAVAVSVPSFRRWVTLRLWPRWLLIGASLLAFLATVVAWASVSTSDWSVGNGGLVVVGLLSAVLVLTAAAQVGPLPRLFALAPLRWLGRYSYGIYLFHWPIFVILNERRTGLDRGPRFVLEVLVTVVLARLSYALVEQPLRRPTARIGSLTPARLAPVVAGGLVFTTLLVPTTLPQGFDAVAAARSMEQITRDAAESTESTATIEDGVPTTPAPDAATGTTDDGATVAGTSTERESVAPPSVAIFGDSIALSIAFVFHEWALRDGSASFIGGDSPIGCGIGRGGKQKAFGVLTRTEECNGWQPRWQQFVDTYSPDVAMVQSAQWEIVPRQLAGDSTWRIIGDPVYDEFLKREFLAASDVLASRGALVVWLTVPHFSRIPIEGQPAAMIESHRDDRVDRLNEIVREVGAERPGTVRVVDLAAWMQDKVEDTSLRKDGAHFNTSGAGAMASEFLGDAVVGAYREWSEASISPSVDTDTRPGPPER